MMKTPEQIRATVTRKLEDTWTDTLAAELAGHPGASGSTEAATWPRKFPLGKVTSAEAATGFAELAAAVQTWRAWEQTHQVTLDFEKRRLLGTPQQIPTHLVIDAIDEAARLSGPDWVARLDRGRTRAAELTRRFPHLTAQSAPAPPATEPSTGTAAPADTAPCLSLARVLSEVDPFTDTDFQLLCSAGEWFAGHDATGLTPRQVPIEGLHAKWLNSRRHLVAALAHVDDLGLVVTHPPRIHFTYLDPDYRAAGGRIHDSATVGDTARPAYRPSVVVISENKDTALYFPPVPGGISVEGVGRGGSTVASFDWLVGAAHVAYWGDMDADGLEILNEFRQARVPAVSLLMNPSAYHDWHRFGTDTDRKGNPLTARTPRAVPHLTDDERQLYEALCAPTCPGFRRIEQERIPLQVARDALRAVVAGADG